jgi:anti-sigma-K factor RskA
MTSPAPNYEELAALHALGLLDEAGTRQLYEAANRDPEVRRFLQAFDETAAHLALEAPVTPPPPGLREEILRALPPAAGKVVRFPTWFPVAIAACLMILTIAEAVQILSLRSELRALEPQFAAASIDNAHLRESNALISLRLAALDVKDPAYGAVQVLVAWDSNQHRGAIGVDHLPPAPAGHDYQLWVLDPNAPSPLNAGVLVASRAFDEEKVSVPRPGFAVSLEPSGGSPSPTGPILFAVAPAE